MVRMFKRNLLKEYQEYWSKSLNKDKFDSSVGNKLSLYSEVKNEVRFESYLDLIKNVKTRVAVTKMRISCHLLPIESGRYKKIPRVERLCPLCNRSENGDEFHYLLKCTHSSLSYKGSLLGEPILYGRFLGFYVNGFLSREKTVAVYIKTHKTAINRPVDHTGET